MKHNLKQIFVSQVTVISQLYDYQGLLYLDKKALDVCSSVSYATLRGLRLEIH